jgi:6-pyruvoyltetrahydropterin/6-carboxytetrahydropterin synthase
MHNPELTDEENRAIYGRCNNPRGHGHNYVLEVTVAGEPDPRTGMIINLTELEEIVNKNLVDQVDHRHLNHDVPFLGGVIPAAENLVRVFWNVLADHLPRGMLHELKLYESEKNWVSYRGE